MSPIRRLRHTLRHPMLPLQESGLILMISYESSDGSSMKTFSNNPQSSANTLKVPMSSAEGTCGPLGTFQNDTDVVLKLVCFASPSPSWQWAKRHKESTSGTLGQSCSHKEPPHMGRLRPSLLVHKHRLAFASLSKRQRQKATEVSES